MSTCWTCALLVGLMVTGTSGRIRDWADNVAALEFYIAENQPLVVALYLLVLSAIVDLALLPIGFYKGYLLERKYGLATESALHWFWDYIKAVFIGLVFALIAGEFVYFAIRQWPDWWWVIAGFAYALVTIALVKLAPVLLLPLFFKFKPLENVELCDRLTKLAARANTRVMGVYEWKLSDRTKKANAALAGMGNTRRIILSDTLLSDYSEDEIEVILAHELAHHVHRDIWKAVIVDTLLTFAGFYLVHLLLGVLVAYFHLLGPADPAGLPILLVAAGAMAFALKPFMNAQSRRHERSADAYALRLTKNPTAFISAMRRLGQQNLAEENPSRLVQAFFYTHPPIKDRVRAAKEWAAAIVILGIVVSPAAAQQPRGNPADTEIWEPVPRRVTPAAVERGAPSDAIVLFDGKNLDEWISVRDKSPAGWRVENGVLTVNKSAGNIETKRRFRDYQLHIEWLIPENITGANQARGNSGVFLASTGPGDAGYELQVLDSYENKTYVNGQAGSVYKQSIPLVNASRKPGEWQTYDIVWTAPRFNADGTLKTPAAITAFHNGVLIQNHFELRGETVFIGTPSYKPYETAPIKLQAHGDPSPPISFRNIWVRELH